MGNCQTNDKKSANRQEGSLEVTACVGSTMSLQKSKMRVTRASDKHPPSLEVKKAPSCEPALEVSPQGMNGTIYGEQDHKDLPWDVICVFLVKDLEKNQHLYRLEIKCVASTKVADLQKRAEWMLEFVSKGTNPFSDFWSFSQSKVGIQAMVPMKADDWIEASKPGQTVGEIEAKFGTRAADRDPAKPGWQHHGQQKKELKFYATVGAPTGQAGFLCWETAGFPGPDLLTVTISNDLKVRSE